MKSLMCALGFCCLWLIALRSSAQPMDTAQLVVQADMPLFLHEGDRMEMAVHLTNKTSNEITGQAVLQLADAASGTAVDGWFQNVFPAQYFTIEGGKTAVVSFPVEVPYLFKKALAWRATATAQHLSGSATGVVPVLTTKALHTETVLLPAHDSGTLSFMFQNLVLSGADAEHQSLSIEAFFDPLRKVIETLPHLVTAQPETTEALWYRFYAFALAAKVRAASPEWMQAIAHRTIPDTSAWATLLQKNNRAASLIAAETPWAVETMPVAEAHNPFRIDAGSLRKELARCIAQLKERQKKNGSFAWLTNGPEDRYTTACILTGMGFLKRLKALPEDLTTVINTILEPALAYMDKQLESDFTALKNKKMSAQEINPLQVQYLYVRSFFAGPSISSSTLPAYQHYVRQAQRQWQTKSPLLQSMIALALHRQGNKNVPPVLLQLLKRTVINDTDSHKTAFHWWQAPAETTALLLEAFNEITGDVQIKNTLISALLQQKEENMWRRGKATAHACYALLLMPAPPAGKAPLLEVQLGDTRFSNENKDTARRGFSRHRIYPPLLQPQSGRMQVTVQPRGTSTADSHPYWVAISWRYFTEQHAVTLASAKVAIQKKLFVKSGASKKTGREDNSFRTGDTIQVQLTLTTDRALESIHIKDVHAAALEPVDGAATYRTGAATHFYLPAIAKGVTVLRYAAVATRAGTFSTGLATVEGGHTSALLALHNAVRIQIE